ncbi:MAG: hypothetical protein MPN21_16625 [Thermoanaerobaculia bacterium]|nr:hypothetical protein [Thermoanaerobaculia bacterium]
MPTTTCLARIRLLFVGAAGMLLTTAASAQFDQCDDSEPVLVCLERLISGRAMATAEERVKEKAAIATEAGGAGALVDILSPLFATLGLGDPESENGNLTAKKNFDLGESWRGTLGATLLADPDIYPPLQSQLEEALDDSEGGDRISKLKSEISEYQNLNLQFQLSYEGAWLGRVWGRRTEKYESLVGTAMGLADSATGDHGLRVVSKVLTDRPELQLLTLGTVSEARAGLRQIGDPEKVNAFIEAFDQAVEAEQTALRALRPRLASDLRRIADMVANQPQLLVKATYKDREDTVVGPDSLEASLKLEFGVSGNLNDLDDWADGDLAGKCRQVEARQAGGDNHSCLDTYLAETGKQPEKGNRFSLGATYAEIDAFEFELPEQGFSFSTPKTEKWTAALSFGRWLSGVSLGGAPTRSGRARLDLEAKWEDPADDEMKQDRVVATLTLSQKASACMTMSLGLVWANEPEFRGEVDEELSARLGLRWDNKKTSACRGGGS